MTTHLNHQLDADRRAGLRQLAAASSAPIGCVEARIAVAAKSYRRPQDDIGSGAGSERGESTP
jgi:hypothetical protein